MYLNVLPSFKSGRQNFNMDVKGVSALDLRFLVRELRERLEKGKVRKIYQYEKKRFMVEFFVPGKGGARLYFDSGRAFLTERKLPSPEPPSFCMFLRKHLMGKGLIGIEQHGFDRILELKFPDNVLVIEMIPPGNVILCDSSYRIIMPLEIQKWKDRIVKHKEAYRHPPPQRDPFLLGLEELQGLLKKSEKKLGAFLAVDLGLGRAYSDELCLRAGVSREKGSGELGLEDVSKLHSALEGIRSDFSPHRYDDFASPFGLKSREGGEELETFSQAMDGLFAESPEENKEKKETKTVEEEKERIERIIETQGKAVEKLSERREGRKDSAESIYRNYSLVDGVLQGIRKARDSGLSWEDIMERVKSEGTEEAQVIKEIRKDDGVVVVELEGKEVELDFRLGVEENASRYFEKSKDAKRKMEGALEAREEKEKELEQVPEQLPEAEPEKIVKKKPRKKWYEKFRWFFSSDGFLVIGGKDAKQNEMIFSKYLKPGDKVFHADIPGAALVVIQSEGREVTEEAKREAAEFSAAKSKAWSRGFGTMDVYCVDPEQVSKTPPSGTYLPKGSFAITGQRQWFRETVVKLAVGVKIDREKELTKVVAGPVLSMRKNANYFITIKPGFKKSLELARSIKNKLLMRASIEDKHWIEEVPLEEIQKIIPSGMGEIVEYG